jgi:pimeloyl-ACP methyl ester carboxylesterase
MLTTLTDILVLRPTRHPIAAEHKTRHALAFAGGEVELWRHRSGPDDGGEPDLVLLKFGGAGGRAERATEHPADYWPDLRADVWAFNPPGFGGSSGRASLQSLAELATLAYEHVCRETDPRRLVVTGNSLGGVIALYLAARHPVSGLLLRNSPPLRELIVDRFGWWNFWLGARLIARQIPAELDAVANAARVTAPALFLSARRDRIVWPRHQELIIDAYAGEKRVLPLAEADHGSALTEAEQREYARLLDWFRQRVFE